jgi:hypothetical protein
MTHESHLCLTTCPLCWRCWGCCSLRIAGMGTSHARIGFCNSRAGAALASLKSSPQMMLQLMRGLAGPAWQLEPLFRAVYKAPSAAPPVAEVVGSLKVIPQDYSVMQASARIWTGACLQATGSAGRSLGANANGQIRLWAGMQSVRTFKCPVRECSTGDQACTLLTCRPTSMQLPV